jgi:outer membrane beta-barrel protein
MYSPDLGTGDLKGLTTTLVSIAHEGTDQGFQQPIEKMILGATFAARWAPVYGKINLLGERVLNFDLYGVAGLGLLSINEYYATYTEEGGVPSASLGTAIKKNKVPVNLGLGMDFFVSSSVAVKIDARSYLYLDKKPQYDPDVAVEESRLYNNFIASAGVSVFFPKMKPRQYDF